MKYLPVLLLLGTTHLTAQAVPPTGNPGGDNQVKRWGRVEGKMVNSVNDAPIGKVTLTLRGVDPTQESKYMATSDTEGGFLFDHVEAGRYTLYAQKPGFVPQYYGTQRATRTGTPLTLSEGQLLKDLLFMLTPQAVISGKITDDAGEPVDKVSVVAMQWGYSQGKRLLRPVGGALANDLGEYRIANLKPGSYYVAARRGDFGPSWRLSPADTPSGAVPKTPEEDYHDTYYPGSLDSAGASQVQAAPGSELRGIDIQFRKARVFRVRGQVVDGATGQAVTDATVVLTQATPDSVLNMSRLGGPRISSGKFEVTSVLPGSYHLMAQVIRNSQTLYARESIYVANQSVTDIIMRIPAAVNVFGRVRVSGQEPQTPTQQEHQQTQQQSPPQGAFRMESLRILLYPAEGFGLGALPQATAQADGSFVLRNVVPDKFQVRVSGTPPGWYLKSILIGGRESPDGTVVLAGGGNMEIVFAMDAAEVTGNVVDTDDKPVSGAVIAVVPEDPSKQGRIDLFRGATSDQNGQFQIGGLVAGSYKIFAWEQLESGAEEDAEFRRPFESKAKSVSLSENGRETVKVKAIPLEDVAKALSNRPNI